jgi:hypothetical protein
MAAVLSIKELLDIQFKHIASTLPSSEPAAAGLLPDPILFSLLVLGDIFIYLRNRKDLTVGA